MRQALPMILIRLLVGLIFVLEGLQKILLPAVWGVAHFAAIGMPAPQIVAPAVGGFEIVCGLALVLNLYAGESAILLIALMIGAIISSRIPILTGHPLGPFVVPPGQDTGWLPFLHESRLEFAMLLGSLAIAIDSGIRLFRRREWYNR